MHDLAFNYVRPDWKKNYKKVVDIVRVNKLKIDWHAQLTFYYS